MKRYKLEQIFNFRDLGGYEARYGMTSHGVIFRSADMSSASKKDIEKIHSLGIKTIIDFRSSEVASAYPSVFKNDPDVKYLHLEVNGKGRIPVDHDDTVASYLEMLEDPYSARTIFKAILNEEKPLAMHCSAGKDRTGCITMILLMLNGVDFDDINADYMASFPYLRESAFKLINERPETPPVLYTPDIFMLVDIKDAFLKRYGDVTSYCEHIGLSEDEIRGLSNLLGRQETSCGAVIFNNGKILIEHSVKGHYTLPKGHVEAIDKDKYATASREIKEETGLDVSFVPGFETISYYSPEEGVLKKTIFFVATSDTNETTPQKEEVSQLIWVSPEDSLIVLSHDSDREIAAKAANFYSNKK